MAGRNSKKTCKVDSKGSAKSWQGRLSADADQATAQFVASLDVDQALWSHDIAGSLAHARMLSEAGLLTGREFQRISQGLSAIAEEIRSGLLDMPIELEDIHMVIEKSLIDRIGQAGAKLHTGRSRNDQVALDLRLWAKQAIDELSAAIRLLQVELVAQAGRCGQIVMPAYTHLQRAQPILAGHSVLAYVEMLHRDADRLSDARKRTDVSPLGCGAVAGTSLAISPARTAELLGFQAVARNSIDATSDRDFLAELCFACALLGVHLSRWAEDWIIYSSTEFGLIELHDAYCTSSSMMPQKKNPDTLELIRAKSAVAIAQLTGILTLLKGLPLAYNRDLQDDKRFVIATVSAMLSSLRVARGIAATTRFCEGQIARSLDAGYLDATALAEYLVGRGVPFRQAHQMVGKLIARAQKDNVPLARMPLEQIQASCPSAGQDVYKYIGAENVVRRYKPPSSAGPGQLRKQLAYWKKKLI